MGEELFGNPWIFEKINYFLRTGEKKEWITKEEKLNVILEHMEKEVEEKGETVGVREMRKHIACYTKNMKDASSFRNEINHINDKDELLKRIDEYFL